MSVCVSVGGGGGKKEMGGGGCGGEKSKNGGGGGGGGGNNEMWWRWCWMENSRNVVLEEERDRNVVEGLLAMV